jgi:putative ABC transport system permease protein
MHLNYLKTTIRNIRKNTLFSAINVFGLSIGITCAILMGLYIHDELSFDHFHSKGDRIYRVVTEKEKNGETSLRNNVAVPMADALSDEFPDIEKTAIFPLYGVNIELEHNEKCFHKNNIWYADNNIFDMFDFIWLYGNPETAFNTSNSLVITATEANKLFGDENPVGKTIQCLENYYSKSFTILGVIKEMPKNSRFQFDGLASSEDLYAKPEFKKRFNWHMRNFPVYVMLNKHSSPDQMKSKFSGFIKKYLSQNPEIKDIHLQPLKKVHIDMDPLNELPTDKDNKSIYILIIIGISILGIAAMNFVNLSIANVSERENEVALRKISGAGRGQIFRQFLSESILFSVLAAGIAIVLVKILLPVFSQFTDKELLPLITMNPVFYIICLGSALLVGVIVGIYPAIYGTRFISQQIFNGRNRVNYGNRKYVGRRFFVICQYVISICFIVCTITIYRQTSFLRDKNLGYDKEHIIVLPYFPESMGAKYKPFKTELLRKSTFTNITRTSFFPGGRGFNQNVWWEGLPDKGNSNWIFWMTVDPDFIQTLKLQVVQGNNFDERGGYILTEGALNKIGWQNPIGKQMDIVGKGQVIGVVKDFHFKSLHHEIKPLVLCVYPDEFRNLFVRISPEDIHKSLDYLESSWEQFFPGEQFQFSFLDDTFEDVYKSELKVSKVFSLFSFLAIIIACLGLLGLANFITNKRIKEIGIRKVNGAKISEILIMLNKNFIKWVVIAFVIAVPVSYYAMNKWLENFAYKTTISWWVFALAGFLALGIALLTVSWQSWKAATRNPVEALRYE